MQDGSIFTPYLESVKRFLISTPWEATAVAGSSSQHGRQSVHRTTSAEPAASTVLCELLELRRLRGLLLAASTQQQQQQGEHSETTRSQHDSSRRSRKKKDAVKPSAADHVLWCVRQRYGDLRASCSAPVQSLCADLVGTSTRDRDAKAADGLAAFLAEVDVVDVFLTLLLCLSAALCWHHKQQQQHIQAVRTTRVNAAGVVSSSRDGSEHSQVRTNAASVPHTSVYAALRHHYGVDTKNGQRGEVRENHRRLHGVLRRLLPLFEARLPLTEMWREPSLLAALDVVARGAWTAQACVHGTTQDPAHASATVTRCPLCYATALDDDLAVEALTQLQHYHTTYHSIPAGGAEGDAAAEAANFVSVQARGWLAACRTAQWNDCRAALRCLAKTASPPPPPWLSAHRPVSFVWTREAPAVLGALWQLWWTAEVRLGATHTTAAQALFVKETLRRDTSKRLRSCLLFLEMVEAAARATAGVGAVTCESQRQACLRRLLALPLPLVLQGDGGGVVSGTALHWLCAQGDVLLVQLLLLHTCAHDPTQLSVWAAAQQQQQQQQQQGQRSHMSGPDTLPLRGPQQTPHVVRLAGRSGHNIDHQVLSPAAARTSSDSPSSSLPPPPPPPSSLRVHLTYGAAQLRHLLCLADSRGHTALDTACARGDLLLVRLLLQAGCSPNTLCPSWWATYANTVPLPLLHLLDDPSLLNGAAGAADGAEAAKGGGRPLGLAERLRATHCCAAAARTLALLAHRLWVEKTQHIAYPTATAKEGSRVDLDAWCSGYGEVQAAQDRVLRPAFAALAYDAQEPLARLVLLAVLTRKLREWLRTTPPHLRCGSRGGVHALRDARLHHSVALRLYTQLTCPLGRRLLHRAVTMRTAVCAAVEAREASAVALLTAASQRDYEGTEEEGGGTSTTAAAAATPLPLSAAARAREELQRLYAAVLADVQRLDPLLAAEQHAAAASTARSVEDDVAAVGAAAVLRGRAQSGMEMEGPATAPSYALVVIPSAAALHEARWGGEAATMGRVGSPAVVVEPTLWCPTPPPYQVWVRLPHALDLEDLLRRHGGGGYGVVAQDMPLTAPLQRGDLLTFRRTRQSDGRGGGGGAVLPGQFVVQAIFSDRRTLPYVVVSQSSNSSSGVTSSSGYAAPPTSLSLPFEALAPQPTHNTLCSTVCRAALSRLQSAAAVTMHGCCLPAAFVEECNAEEDEAVKQQQQQHPLDWLQVRPDVGTAANDVLAALRTDRRLVSRWSRLVWAGLQPCWLTSVSDTSHAGTAGAHASSPPPPPPLHTHTMMNLFTTLNTEGVGGGSMHHPSVLDVLLASTHNRAECGGEGLVSADWASRADTSAEAVGADLVVRVRV